MNRDGTQGLLVGIDASVEWLFVPPDPALENALRRSGEAEDSSLPERGEASATARGHLGGGASWR